MPALRLFIAVFPPRDAAEALLRELAALPLPAHRPVPAQQVHLTLRFLGETPAEQLPTIEAVMRKAATPTRRFTLRPARLIGVPARRPRLVAAATDAPNRCRAWRARCAPASPRRRATPAPTARSSRT